MSDIPMMPGLVDQRDRPIRGEPIDTLSPPMKPKEKPKEKEPCKTTVADLQKVFPSAHVSQLKQVADLINRYGKDFGIDDDETLRYFVSQAGAETANMTRFTEGTTYHLSRLHAVWPHKFNTREHPTANPKRRNPNDFAHSKGSTLADPVKLFNYVYGGKNGNNKTGDGYKYRGRGLLHLTWKSNYEAFTKFYQKNYDASKDFIIHPELLNDDKKVGVISGLWYFKTRVSNHKIDNSTTIDDVSRWVNGGKNGLSERKRLYNKAKTNVKCRQL